ncbi:MAG TPA: hypothetical protein VFC63_01545 [Blastocatellia bacterium]|nr:hypothetical protein [Blastocatellia bacterium]
MKFKIFSGVCFLLFIVATCSTGFSQGTYGPGNMPNRPPRIDEKASTTAVVVDVFPDEDLIKVKDEITNETKTYKVSVNADISGDKKEFGKKRLTLKDIQKGRRIKLVYYKTATNLAQEIQILKPKDTK